MLSLTGGVALPFPVTAHSRSVAARALVPPSKRPGLPSDGRGVSLRIVRPIYYTRPMAPNTPPVSMDSLQQSLDNGKAELIDGRNLALLVTVDHEGVAHIKNRSPMTQTQVASILRSLATGLETGADVVVPT